MFVSMLAAAPALAQRWTSQLFPDINGKFTIQTVTFNGRQWTLDDYSYSGYYLGGRSPGSVPCKVQTLAAGDISVALQAAIDAIGKTGGGIVRLPAGSFTMSAPVQIPYSNVSIEGAGSGQTAIEVPSNYASLDDPYDGLFTFGKTFGTTNDGWIDKGVVASTVSKVIQRGDMQVDADNASSIKIGDWIVVQQYFWPAFVAANSHAPDAWTPNTVLFSFDYLRQVTAKTDNRVFIDAPIPWTLDPANNPIRLKFTDNKMQENVGLKGVSIHFANNIGSGGRPHGTAVFFDGVRNGWVYDVHVANFPRNGIYTRFAARITILDSVVVGAQDAGGDGYGYGFLTDYSQSILIKRCRGEQARHNFISSRALVSVLAQTQCISRNPTQPDDTHYSFEQAVLFDQHRQEAGEGLVEVNRGDESVGAYQTLGSGVVWNLSGDGTSRNEQGAAVFWAGEVHVAPSPLGQAIMVGGPGAAAVYDNSDASTTPQQKGQLVPPAAGFQVGGGANAPKNVLYEGLGQPGLQPPSLYEAQLANRFSPPPADFVNACGPSPASAANAVTNAASFAAGAVSPGEIVTVFGANLGPALGANLQLNASGLVDTMLAGTRLFFDGNPAPMIYSRADQISSVVPYAVAGSASTMLQIEYQGQRSGGFPVPVTAATPALFTFDGTGKGGGAILNASGGVNTPGNPVARGDIVILYATGAGQTDPPGVDGLPAGAPLPKPLLPVQVRIDGVLADDVPYAGAAPGLVAGVLQVNVRVPMSVTTGQAVPVELRVGGAPSQTGVTLAVK